MKKKEVEDLVVTLAKDDVKPSSIGLVLRDTHGVPSVKTVTGKSITQILNEAKLLSTIPEDLSALVEKAKKLKKHLLKKAVPSHILTLKLYMMVLIL